MASMVFASAIILVLGASGWRASGLRGIRGTILSRFRPVISWGGWLAWLAIAPFAIVVNNFTNYNDRY